MIRLLGSAGIVFCLIFAGVSGEAADVRSLDTARTAIEKWVETRQLISETRSDWQADKETLNQTMLVFERELKGMDEQFAKMGTNSVQVDKERAETEAQLATANAALDAVKQFATGFEADIKKLVPRLPEPLQDIVKPFLNRLPEDPASSTMTAADRVAVLVGILNELDKFNNAVSIFSTKQTNDKGESVAVETVFVGLGAAYFVNELNDFAGTGAPGPDGWEWKTRSEIAPAVREIVRIYRNERTARFVLVPAEIR